MQSIQVPRDLWHLSGTPGRRTLMLRIATIRGEEVSTVQWDLGLQGIALLAVMAVAFGIFAQLVLWGVRWVWLIGSAAFFVVGAFISEVMFGWATQEELQPNYDGLSFDEVLIGYLLGIVVVLVARFTIGRSARSAAQRPVHG
jgi:hypothetical protein